MDHGTVMARAHVELVRLGSRISRSRRLGNAIRSLLLIAATARRDVLHTSGEAVLSQLSLRGIRVSWRVGGILGRRGAPRRTGTRHGGPLSSACQACRNAR